MKKTGQRIKELREELEFTQAKLGEKVGKASNTIVQYENGTSKMSIDVLTRMAQVLKTSSDYLLGLTDMP